MWQRMWQNVDVCVVDDLPEANVNKLSLKHKTHRDTNDERHQRKQYTYLLAIIVRIP